MPAAPAPAPGQRRVSRRGLLIGGAALVGAAVLGGGGLLYFTRNTPQQSPPPPPTGTIPITLTYSTEKSGWMNASVAAFNKSNTRLGGKAIQVTLDPRGSVDAQQRILSGALLPVAWSPASSLELNQLSTAWRQAHNGQDVIVSSGDLLPASLVFSPLVFAVWKERAQVLLHKYGSIDWPSIHDALVLKNGWPDIGGQAAWGQVNFG